MAPLQRKLRRALGTFKDQTSIGIAMVAGNGSSDLDVALVKATSHDEMPIEEKYVQEILHLTSLSRGYVSACVSGIARRLSKTHNWVVAIKALMLTHRLLRDGDPYFEHDLLYGTRRGLRILNLSNFRDDSHFNAWDYSAFVRTYALFLDEKLDYNVAMASADGGSEPKIGVRRSASYDSPSGGRWDDDYGYGGHRNRSYGSDDWRDGEDRRHERKEDHDKKKSSSGSVKDMTPQELLNKIPLMQRLMDRILACRPTGFARMNRLVQIALYPVVRESFHLYTDICDGLAIILDAFFDMEHGDCVKAFEIYTRGAKQIDELATFYGACKNLGVCRSSEYPVVQKVTEELIDTMEDFLRNRSESSRSRKSKSPEPRPKSPEPEPETEDVELNGMKALPAPPVAPVEEPVKETPPPLQKEPETDLLGLNSDPVSVEEHGDRLALALFSDTITSSSTTTIQSSLFSGERQLSGWELALVESTSEISKPVNKPLAGGFDNLLLTSMYDQATVQQKAAASIPAGSASSVALPGRPASSFLALPAPVPQIAEDPFAASMSIPPPAYVQMEDMRVKQQLLVQEQQTWYQYQQDGMRGYNGLMKFHNPGYSTLQAYQPVPYYGAYY